MLFSYSTARSLGALCETFAFFAVNHDESYSSCSRDMEQPLYQNSLSIHHSEKNNRQGREEAQREACFQPRNRTTEEHSTNEGGARRLISCFIPTCSVTQLVCCSVVLIFSNSVILSSTFPFTQRSLRILCVLCGKTSPNYIRAIPGIRSSLFIKTHYPFTTQSRITAKGAKRRKGNLGLV